MQICVSRTTDFSCFGVLSVVLRLTHDDFSLRTIPYIGDQRP